ncbi:MAG TPA: sulfurtransferase [Chromatiaceae bacterium]|jgi:rhodanese-related sulfurtransferase|nr:MAG: sulfurtransferase [Thiohalocapsa sp. PB-PSB1]HBG93723.1 sulfurtransferase [Chromatiaceae bacterium]HCS88790.1 sulfurtransferase [Chromatiaceae bacterium]
MQQLNPHDLQDLLRRTQADRRPWLLDVREPWEFNICRIEGSQLVPMRQIPAQVQSWSDDIKAEQSVVVICHHGIRSQQVALYLERQGFAQVYNLQGGVDAWARDVDPAMAKY